MGLRKRVQGKHRRGQAAAKPRAASSGGTVMKPVKPKRIDIGKPKGRAMKPKQRKRLTKPKR